MQEVYSSADSTSICASRWNSSRYLAILYKVWSWTSTWSRRLEKLNKTDVHIYMARHWSVWLCPHDSMFHLRGSDCDCCWLSNSSPPATRSSVPIHYPLLPLISSVEKTRREDYDIECKAFMLHNAPSLYRVSTFLCIFLESGLI